MIENLVIVESPAKAKTIEKFLGKAYKVMSSYGHIRDLKKRDISINKGHDFEPVYEVPADKIDLVNNLKRAAAEAKIVWLASDEDREGEAIAWHLFEVLNLNPATTRRIVFHEITKTAILNAIKNPREIDINLVDAQQARRVLDRIVGFELSPVLWRKIRPSLSAGRVQSVAVRLIVERENEIRKFNAEPYFRTGAVMVTADGSEFRAELNHRFPTSDEAEDFLKQCSQSTFAVGEISRKPQRKSPAAPFTTSTLQQEASRKLGFTVAQTMTVAQRLYEAGHITYMRTDSLNLSTEAINAIAGVINNTIGPEYLMSRRYHTNSKGAQEAHEAIRPTYPATIEIDGNEQERKLYDLIRKRTIASQMKDAEIERTSVEIGISNSPRHFTATGEVVRFDGFLRIYTEGTDADPDADETSSGMLPTLSTDEHLTAKIITATERYTLAPPRYTEASLVKKMEELGIGRPSTYAPTISTIQQRGYVKKGGQSGEPRSFTVLTLANGNIHESSKTENVGSDKGKLIPTDTGIVVNDFLTEYFPNILDYNFTAQVEERFDKIADGEAPWHGEIERFYDVFHPEVVKASDTRLEHKVGERLLGNDPESGKPVFVKIGRYGPMVQIGESQGDDKPRFASLRNDQSVFDLTLDEALRLFDLPRTIGTFEDSDVIVGEGKYGPYVKHAGKYVSIPRDIPVNEISIDQAIDLIHEKREADSRRIVKLFPDDPDMQILNGRYGIYISYRKKNYKIPKSIENPADLTIDECRELVKGQDSKSDKPKVRRTTRTKKTPTK